MSEYFSMKKIVLGTIGYLLLTFPLAYVWHLVLFADTYESLGYIGREQPIIAFGFGAILLQGILLSFVYPYLCRGTTVFRGAAKFVLVMGGYHWTMHVLASAAKNPIGPLPTWFAVESVYLLIQFVNGGLLLALVYRDLKPTGQGAVG